MALHTENPIRKTTLVAVGTVTKRRFVRPSGAMCNAAGQMAVGVSGEEDTDSGKSFSATIEGTALVESAEALTVATRVMSDASGKAVHAYGKKNYIAGVVMRDQSTTGELVTVFLSGRETLMTTTTTTSSTSSTSSTTSTTSTTTSTTN